MTDLDRPESSEDLYRDRRPVPSAIPVMQGDVFAEIDVANFGGDVVGWQVVMHPCSMRSGKAMREHITMAPVRKFDGRVGNSAWTGNVNRMLLPNLYDDGVDYYSELRELAPGSRADLTLTRRVATLSAKGLLLLQQRYAFSVTRIRIDLDQLEEQMTPTFTEMELQETWVEAFVDRKGDDSDGEVSKAADLFQDWLDLDNRSRRIQLKQVRYHAEVRRACTEELRTRLATEA